MASFSFAPLPPIDTVNQHTIFLIIAGLCLVCFILTALNDEHGDNLSPTTRVLVVITAASALVSWNTGEIIQYKNETTTGTFAGYVAEGYTERQTSGKTTSNVAVHNTYVVYMVEGSRVLFRSSVGVQYPDTVVLYKN